MLCNFVQVYFVFISGAKELKRSLDEIHSLILFKPDLTGRTLPQSITDMTVVVFLGKLCWGTVGRAANLRTDFVSLLRWPGVAQITNLDMQPTKLLGDFQVLNVHVTFHHRFSKCSSCHLKPET
jgi:hypothetical protein